MAMIELKRLNAFVTVVEAGSITRAAELLFIQQPPLTRLLQGLEQDFGVPLLKRLPRGVITTEAGEVLVGAGLGISIVPESMTRLGGDGVVFLPLDPTTQLSAPLYLARRGDCHASSIINTFCQRVKTQLAGN